MSATSSLPAPPALPSGKGRHCNYVQLTVVGEAESGRSSLAATAVNAASFYRPARCPLVASGASAALGMHADVVSIETYDIESVDRNLWQLTVVDSGPIPLSCSGASTRLLTSDVVLLCFPLVEVKQWVENGSGGEASTLVQTLIPERSVDRLLELMAVVRSRCSQDAAPMLILVGTFHDTLRDTSLSATADLLRQLHRLCNDRANPACLPVARVAAVSTTASQCVLLTKNEATELPLSALWHRILKWRVKWLPPTPASKSSVHQKCQNLRQRCNVFLANTPKRESQETVTRVVRAALVHPPRLYSLPSFSRRAASLLHNWHLGSGALDRQVQTYEVDIPSSLYEASGCHVKAFLRQLKRRGKVMFLSLRKLWGFAYAMGLRSTGHLYLILREMETEGELIVVGPALSLLPGGDRTDLRGVEEVCLLPALLHISHVILWAYVALQRHYPARHASHCLRDIPLERCEAADPLQLARCGIFTAELLQLLSKALGMQKDTEGNGYNWISRSLVSCGLAYVVESSSPVVRHALSISDCYGEKQKQRRPSHAVCSVPDLRSQGSTDAASSNASPTLSLSSYSSRNRSENRGVMHRVASFFLLDANDAAADDAVSDVNDRSLSSCDTGHGMLLIVPSLQLPSTCPPPLRQSVLRLAAQLSKKRLPLSLHLRCSYVAMQLSPSPSDFFSLYISRLAQRSQTFLCTYSDAIVLNLATPILLPNDLEESEKNLRKTAEMEDYGNGVFIFGIPASDNNDNYRKLALDLHIVIFGSGELVATLSEAELLDDLCLFLKQQLPGICVTPVDAEDIPQDGDDSMDGVADVRTTEELMSRLLSTV